MKQIAQISILVISVFAFYLAAEDHPSDTVRGMITGINVFGPEANYNAYDNVTLISVRGATPCWVDNSDPSGKALVAFAMFAYSHSLNVRMRFHDDTSKEKRGKPKCIEIQLVE